jgi:hypothetical protein
MPMYEIECARCHKIAEFILGLSEVADFPAGKVCEFKTKCVCGSNKFKRLISKHGETKVNWAAWRNSSTK